MKLKITGIDKLLENIDLLKAKMVKGLKDIINVNSHLLQTHLRQDFFTPGSPGSRGREDGTLNTRSGLFKRAIKVIPMKIKDGDVSGGVSFGTTYAKVHVGPRGQSMTIRPKTAKMLTIPLKAAQGPHGQAKGFARDQSVFGETFIRMSKKGNLIIFGKTKYSKGERAGQARGSIVPLFLLVKSVTVKTRIHPEDLIKWVKPKIVEDIKEMIK